MMLFVPPQKHASVQNALKSLVHVPVRFETSGSQVIFFEHEEDFEEAERERAHQNITPFRELGTPPQASGGD